MDVAESSGPAERLQNLLLAMTGRVDDDAINSARELLGLGQLDAAAEFLTGCLLSGRIPVSSTEQYELRRVLDEVRSHHGLADTLQIVDMVPDEAHRFGAVAEPDTPLVEALAPIAKRLADVRALWCTWRVTPAGVTYGAVPRRVLLVEVGSDGSVAAAGYQLVDALRRAGIGCSVDVFSTGTDLPEYHRNALSEARQLTLDSGVTSRNGRARARETRASTSAEPVTRGGGGHELSSESPSMKRELRVEPAGLESRGLDSTRSESRGLESRGLESRGFEQQTDTPPTGIPAAARSELAQASSDDPQVESGNNMRVPAAVDAKLTDRERNLLRKLHEELAQREQDRGVGGRGPARRALQQDTRNRPLPGTGGFPPISAASGGNLHAPGGPPNQAG